MHEICAKFLVTLDDRELQALPEEHFRACRVYIDYVMDLQKRTRGKLYVEQQVSLASISPEMFGTVDALIPDLKNGVLHVIDFKYGAGITVEVKGNLQLKAYALGALLSLRLKGIETAFITIVQPRAFHPEGTIRSQEIPVTDLLNFAGELEEYAKAASVKTPIFESGDHCRFCPAAAICPTLNQETNSLAAQAFSSAKSYEPEKLSAVLDRLPILEAWIKSVRDFAFSELDSGEKIPGWKLVPKRAIRKWKDEQQVVEYLTGVCGYAEEEIFDKKLKSPAQAEKLLGTRNKAALEDLVSAESSGLTLAPDTNGREQTTREQQAALVFNGERNG